MEDNQGDVWEAVLVSSQKNLKQRNEGGGGETCGDPLELLPMVGTARRSNGTKMEGRFER